MMKHINVLSTIFKFLFANPDYLFVGFLSLETLNSEIKILAHELKTRKRNLTSLIWSRRSLNEVNLSFYIITVLLWKCTILYVNMLAIAAIMAEPNLLKELMGPLWITQAKKISFFSKIKFFFFKIRF